MDAGSGQDAEKPVYHVAPKQGWVNDPNGPFMYRGQYHLFYQHLPQGCEWAFGLVWGHSVSRDLIHWEHLPHAIVPTGATLDADGCFSGCATIDTDGTPVLLYTGVRLRTNPDAAPLPPPECDLRLPFIESQLYATPTHADDARLVSWVKEAAPFIGLPPPNMNLTGWRDPFVVERPCEANNWEWVVLMGSGIKEVGGATIVYRTRSLRDASSWRYDGMLCVGTGDTGAVWECPLLAELSPLPTSGAALGSSSHSRAALGSRRSLTQLGSAASPCSSVVGSPAEQRHWQQLQDKQADRQHEKQQQDKQQQHAQQQHEQQRPLAAPAAASAAPDGGGDGRSAGGGGDDGSGGGSSKEHGNSGGNSSSSANASGSLPSAGLAGGLAGCGGNSSGTDGASRQRAGVMLQAGGPFALCAAGAAFPSFVCPSANLSSWDERYSHFYSISPDACTNPTIYWLGRYADGRFDLDNAKGPLRLDLGDVLYAPNVMRDDAGRLLLWGWLQERRTVGTYDYAGCMTVPRLLQLDHDRLHQSPVPELLALRRGEAWSASHVRLGPEASLSLPGMVGSSFLDIEVVFTQGSASTVGVFLRSWHQGGEGGAALLYNWESNLLEVVFEALDPATLTFSLTAPLARRIGGPISHKPGAPLALRVLLDGSCVEVFTGSGEALSTRVYRGAPPPHAPDAGVEFVALDGEAGLTRVAAYDMASIWERDEAKAPEEAAAAAAAAGELPGLEGLEGLDLLLQRGPSLEAQALAAQLDSALSLTGGLSPASPAGAAKLQSLLSPTGSAALAGQAGGAGGGGAAVAAPGAAYALEPSQLDVMEEEMTADIFDLEAL